MPLIRLGLLSLILSTALLAPADARDPSWSGLGAVAVSPDGKTLAVGGQNRTLYVVDAATFEVKQRIWIKARVGTLAFCKDGSKLVLEDDDERLRWFDTTTWADSGPSKDRCAEIVVAPAADLLAGVAGSWSEPAISVRSLADGSEKASVKLAPRSRVAALGLNADGTRLVVLGQGAKSDEPKQPYNKMPKELKGLAKVEWQQKNDGRMSTIRIHELPSGKLLREHTMWYSTSSGARLLIVGDDVHVITYDNALAKIDKAGEVSLRQGVTSYNYGRDVSAAHGAALMGGLRSGHLWRAKDNSSVKFQLDRLPGWPEYFGGFTFAADGTGYGVTSSFRLLKLSPEGKLLKVVPIF